MEHANPIQWFPGHMTSAIRKIQKDLPLVDAVAQIVDARMPASSRNPALAGILSNKPGLLLFNKCDLADAAVTTQWVGSFQKQGLPALLVNCKTGQGLARFKPAVEALLADKRAREREKGIVKRPLRVMTVGIPNVGKSSFINKLAGQKRAKTEDRPGVTRANQWYKIDSGLELLDTPGLLWPKFENQAVAAFLAFTGAIRDQVLDIETLGAQLIALLWDFYPDRVAQRYAVLLDGLQPDEMLEAIGAKRGMFVRGGEIDIARAAAALLDDFRAGKLGGISLERPEH